MIVELSPEQEALIPVYVEKWRAIALSTKHIDRQKAIEAVQLTYTNLSLEEPEILFFDGLADLYPFVIKHRNKLGNQLRSKLWRELYSQVKKQLHIQLATQLESQLFSQLEEQLNKQLYSQLGKQIYSQLESKLWNKLGNQLWSQISLLVSGQLSRILHSQLSSLFLDFCISVLNCTHDHRKWSVHQLLFCECGWIFAYKKICLVCDYPKKLSYDHQQRLHAEGEPAILFADGYSLYSYHGVTLPEKYGKLHPKQWQAQLLLEQENYENLRILIHGDLLE